MINIYYVMGMLIYAIESNIKEIFFCCMQTINEQQVLDIKTWSRNNNAYEMNHV